ncbi:MAG: phosphatase PAP2 family protein [Candidatus Kapaibacterium sp.]
MLDSLDISLLRQINVNRFTALDSAFIFITKSGPIIAACIPLAFIIIGFLKKKKTIWLEGFMIATPYLLAVVILNILKEIVQRPRPFTEYSYIQKLSEGGSSSFPSGHTSDVFAIAMIMSLFFPRIGVIIPMFLWAALVGYSRMDLGVHYPSDVLAGAILGAGCALFCNWMFRRYRNRDIGAVLDEADQIEQKTAD